MKYPYEKFFWQYVVLLINNVYIRLTFSKSECPVHVHIRSSAKLDWLILWGHWLWIQLKVSQTSIGHIKNKLAKLLKMHYPEKLWSKKHFRTKTILFYHYWLEMLTQLKIQRAGKSYWLSSSSKEIFSSNYRILFARLFLLSVT